MVNGAYLTLRSRSNPAPESLDPPISLDSDAGLGFEFELTGNITHISDEVGANNPVSPWFGWPTIDGVPLRAGPTVNLGAIPQSETNEIDERAEQLLVSHLDSEQREEYQNEGYFHVKAHGFCYRIIKDFIYNIWRMKEGIIQRKYCIVDHTLPMADLMLVQKMMIEADHDNFILNANLHT